MPVTASSRAELDVIQADLLNASLLLIEPTRRAAAEAEASGLSPPPQLEIWAGLQLVSESMPGFADEDVLRDGKQIGAGEEDCQPFNYSLMRTQETSVGFK